MNENERRILEHEEREFFIVASIREGETLLKFINRVDAFLKDGWDLAGNLLSHDGQLLQPLVKSTAQLRDADKPAGGEG